MSNTDWGNTCTDRQYKEIIDIPVDTIVSQAYSSRTDIEQIVKYNLSP